MSDRSKDVAGYVLPETDGPVLTSSLLTVVYYLNREFIELLVAERASQDSDKGLRQARFPSTQALPDNVLQQLGQLGPTSRCAVSNSPFTLYAMRFDDAAFWSSVLHRPGALSASQLPGGLSAAHLSGDPGPPVTSRYGALAGISMRAIICQWALFFVWNVLASSRTAARLLFGLPDTLADQLQRTPLWQLKQVALDYPGILTPRWPRNPAFWPKLVSSAATDDTARLRLMRLLGNQLMALELSGGALQKSRSR